MKKGTFVAVQQCNDGQGHHYRKKQKIGYHCPEGMTEICAP